MTWTSRVPEVTATLERAWQRGVTAGAWHYAETVRKDLRGGYTTGAFTKGHVANAVTVWPAEKIAGDWVAFAGVPTADAAGSLMYALFWEVGHHNLFTRQFERVEVWIPTLVAEGPRIQARIEDVVHQTIDAAVTA